MKILSIPSHMKILLHKIYKVFYNIMNNAQQIAESMVFDYQTTNRTDFRYGNFQQSTKTVYKARPRHEKRSNTRAYTNTYSMTAWKGDMPPFNLYHKPKEVIRTNPNDVQQPFEEDEVKLDEELIKTRPRIVMTPAVSIDDVTDPSTRKILTSDMYMSTTTRALKEAVKSIKYNNVKAPLPGRTALANPIFLPRLQPTLVPPEWRMESVTWDRDQLRAYCNPTERFWLQQELPECKMCEETEAVRVHRNMLRDLKRDNR